MCLHRGDIDQILKNCLKSENYEFISCESSNLDNVSIGFLSSQDRLCIKYRAGGNEEELHVFIKKLPQSPYHRRNIITSGGFHREVVIYDKLLRSFQEHFQDNSIPKCYLARSDEIVVLEDLSYKGFKNRSLTEPFDIFHCEKTLETIAKFHSMSFILEKKEVRKIVDLVPVIKTEVILSTDRNRATRKAVIAGIKALKKVTEIYLAHYPTDLIKKAFDYMESLFEIVKSSDQYPNVLSHSDLWGNNIMFKYDDDGKIKETCIIDFQLATYKPPSYDIQLFLHCCTEREFRDKHYNQLLKHYYTSLEKQLSLSSINLQELLTWQDFENMLKESFPIALTLAPLWLHFILMPENLIKDFMESDEKFKVYYEEDRNDFICLAMEASEHYKQRILESMTEFFNYFNSN